MIIMVGRIIVLKILLLNFVSLTKLRASKISSFTLDEKIYVYESTRWPDNWSAVPSLGNGHLATVVKYPWFYAGGFFNGAKTSSQRAKIPSTTSVYLSGIVDNTGIPLSNPYSTRYWLDTRTGIFYERHYNDMYNITLSWYVHRSIQPLIVFQLEIQNTARINFKKLILQQNEFKEIFQRYKLTMDSYNNVTVLLKVSRNNQSVDMNVVRLMESPRDTKLYRGTTLQAESPQHSKVQTIYWIHDVIPDELTMKYFEAPNKKWTFLTSVHFSKDAALEAYKLGKSWLMNNDKLTRMHVRKWLNLWSNGRIELKGDERSARTATSSLYSLLSCLPDLPKPENLFDFSIERTNRTEDSILFVGLSPSGLSWGDEEAYQGHVFWDQETWMYPPILMLHQSFSPMLLQTRVRTMATALENAKMSGNDGMRFPWESALTGIEVSPSDECGTQEIHINGDIPLAFLQYLQVTDERVNSSCNDVSDLQKMLIGIGDYWLSRMSWNNSSSKYEILCVMPPDEYSTCVNNSVYTNVVAGISLKLAHEIAECLKFSNASIYQKVYQLLYVPFDEELMFHPEYDGYPLGKIVKQADVILLGFPLMHKMSREVRRRDLEIYENVTSERGPAMSDAMFNVGWLEVGELGKALRSFQKMFNHVTGDFQVWTEEKNGQGAPNFITGMGGYLQSLIFGYFGIRIYDDKLFINPTLPEDLNSMVLYGLDYRGHSFDIIVYKMNEMELVWTKKSGYSKPCMNFRGEKGTGMKAMMIFNRKMMMKRAKVFIEII